MEPPPSMKRPANTAILDSDSPHSAVYIAARAEWNERYGSYIAQAHAWRLTALASLGVAFLAVAGVVWIGAQNRVVPTSSRRTSSRMRSPLAGRMWRRLPILA